MDISQNLKNVSLQKAKATKALKHNKYDVSSIKWMLAKLSKESPKLIKEFTTKIP